MMVMTEDSKLTSFMEHTKYIEHTPMYRAIPLEELWADCEQLLYNKRYNSKGEERQRQGNKGNLQPAVARNSTEGLGTDSPVLGHRKKATV